MLNDSNQYFYFLYSIDHLTLVKISQNNLDDHQSALLFIKLNLFML